MIGSAGGGRPGTVAGATTLRPGGRRRRTRRELVEYAPGGLAQRGRLGEDGDREFEEIRFRGNPPVTPRRDDRADEIAPFTNGSGGTLFRGVTDGGEAAGRSRAAPGAVGAPAGVS